ncbi:hypothetical protein GALL_114330 [mine drainage metagenome]|uniref:Uncharacterized protein n=1 Tax=mine drainage metagenome TaxID=410659 RepID=A0A1J5SF20_9ZZZZ
MGLNPPRGGFGEREAPDGLTQWRPIPDFRIGLSKPQPVRQFAEPAFSIDYARQASALEFPPSVFRALGLACQVVAGVAPVYAFSFDVAVFSLASRRAKTGGRYWTRTSERALALRFQFGCPQSTEQKSTRRRRWPKSTVNAFARAKIFGDDFIVFIEAKNHAIFTNTQTPEPDKRIAQRAHIALLSVVHIVKRSADIPSYSWVQFLEYRNHLIGEFHSEIVSAS